MPLREATIASSVKSSPCTLDFCASSAGTKLHLLLHTAPPEHQDLQSPCASPRLQCSEWGLYYTESQGINMGKEESKVFRIVYAGRLQSSPPGTKDVAIEIQTLFD